MELYKMKIVTDKQMKEILARLDSIDSKINSIDFRINSIDSRLDALDCRMDALDRRMDRLETNLTEFKYSTEIKLAEIEANLTEFKHKTEVKLAEIGSTGALCKTQFECMSIIVSSLMAVILLGGGTYLVNMNDRLTNDYKSLQEKIDISK